jgi:aminopeptidase N
MNVRQMVRRLAAVAVVALPMHSGIAATLDMSVSLDPAARMLSATTVITLPASGATEFSLDPRYKVTRAEMNGRSLLAAAGARWRIDASTAERRIEFAWSGQLERLNEESSHRETLRADRPVADQRGSFLPAGANWHPILPGGYSRYQVVIDLPVAQRGIVPGDLIDESIGPERYRATFRFAHRSHGVDLMAGPYSVTSHAMRSSTGKSVTVRTYFHPEIADLADGYLTASQRFINDYDASIGQYPYSIFSVVSSPTPTGFGMPALTYLGIQVLRLPFIRETSLGHEVLHNWWGNGVFVDYARGNWSEGLTAFMADYAFREKAGAAEARMMRLEWLRDLAAVPAADDQPIASFTARHHGSSQIIGYHKVAMVFLMLQDELGQEVFDRAIRQFWTHQKFRRASWDDLREAMEAASQRDLRSFFAQFLTRRGLPAIELRSVTRAAGENPHRLAFALAQSSPPYRVRVPIVVTTAAGAETHHVMLNNAQQTFTVQTKDRALSIALDPDVRVLRRLGGAETPPILRQVMLGADTTLVVPSEEEAFRAAASVLAARFLDHPPRLAGSPPAKGPALIMLKEADAESWLRKQGYGMHEGEWPAGGTARVWATKGASDAVIIVARDTDALSALGRPLPHYGRQSWLVVDGQRVIHRGVWAGRPQTFAIQ